MRGEKKIDKINKKIWMLAAAALLALGLAACGKKEEAAEPEKEFYYVPEYIDCSGDEGTNYYNFMFSGNKLFYSGYVFDESTGEGRNTYHLYDIASRTGEELKIPETEGWMNVQNLSVAEDGSLYVVLSNYIYDEVNPANSREEYFVVKFDGDMNEIFRTDITKEMESDDGMNSYIQYVITDAEGNVYLSSNSIVRLVDKDGKFAGSVDVGDNWISGMGKGKDGKVYVAYSDWSSGTLNMVAAEIDFKARKIGASYSNLPGGNGNMNLVPGLEKDLLLSDSSKVYEYDMSTGTYKELFDWLDSDINGNYVQGMSVTSDGRIAVVVSDWDTGTTEIALLTKTKASDVAKKETILVGTMFGSQELQAAAVNFNKQSDKYRISIRQYYNYEGESSYTDALTRLNNDITSKKNCPDILFMDDSIDTEQLTAKNVLEDLNPYLDKSSELSRDDFLEDIINAYTVDGKLIYIPKSFQISTLAGAKSIVGDKMGWTVQDIIALSKKYPDKAIINYANRESILNILMSFNQDAFIDWGKGTCNFNSDEFIQILEFAVGFPEEVDWGQDSMSTPAKLASGSLLLYDVYVSEFNDIQMTDAMFGEEVTYIGYPTVDGSVGCILRGTGGCAITTKAKDKDGAWKFVESYLLSENRRFFYGLTTKKDKLDEMIENELDKKYMTDENGELILDMDGNPIMEGGGGSISWGDWSYSYRPSTREEIDRLMELVKVARPVSESNEEVMKIITEEAEPFFKGDKTAAEAAALIQSRVSMYVSENS